MDKIKMKNRITNEERRLWVLNEEGLYKWQTSSKLSLRRFTIQNKHEIDAVINNVLSGKKRAHYLVYG